VDGTPSSDLAWDWDGLRRRCLGEARRFVRDPADAEDVVQEALIRGWRGRDRLRSGGAHVGWLLAITRNEAARWRDGPRGRREQRIEDLPGLMTGHDGYDTVLERITVRAAIAGLSEDDRRLLHLRYQEDLTQPQIAEALQIPEGTVKVRLHRVRSRLGPHLLP
jgi:RNA polymerase sigma-70 factor (ECF subfamily)